MGANEKRGGFLGWLVFFVAGIVMAVFGMYAFSTKNHNGFFIAVFLISMGIILFFGKFYAQDSVHGPSDEDSA